MQTRREKVVPYKVYLECTNCGKNMEFTGSALLCSPPLYKHICKSCGETTNTRKQYPTIEYIKE